MIIIFISAVEFDKIGYSKPIQIDINTKDIIEKYITLERTVEGNDPKLTGDYIWANPKMAFISPKGDIITTDEYRIKIYDSTGIGKKILGGKEENVINLVEN
jgi:hypothetical protein